MTIIIILADSTQTSHVNCTWAEVNRLKSGIWPYPESSRCKRLKGYFLFARWLPRKNIVEIQTSSRKKATKEINVGSEIHCVPKKVTIVWRFLYR